jgi:hypothetical protein
MHIHASVGQGYRRQEQKYKREEEGMEGFIDMLLSFGTYLS